MKLHSSAPLAQTPEAVINALPLPVVVIAADGKIVDANVAAESFFEASAAVLKRHHLREFIPFGSPLLSLVDQVRERGGAVNEYRVDLSTPRNPGEIARASYRSSVLGALLGLFLVLVPLTVIYFRRSSELEESLGDLLEPDDHDHDHGDGSA